MSRFPARCGFTSMKPSYFATRKLQLVPAATILIALAMSIAVSAQTITTFDAPGAGTGPLQGTYALNIDPSGTIMGFIRDANDVRHGFVRSQDGSFTIFDARGAALFFAVLGGGFPPSAAAGGGGGGAGGGGGPSPNPRGGKLGELFPP